MCSLVWFSIHYNLMLAQQTCPLLFKTNQSKRFFLLYLTNQEQSHFMAGFRLEPVSPR